MLSSFDFTRKANWLTEYSEYNTKNLDSLLTKEKEEFWEKAGQNQALNLFKFASKNIPAYKDFLVKNKFKAESVKTIEDFKNVPETNNKNYISEYSLEERNWQNRGAQIIAASSGTSGEPKYWPRGGYQEFEASIFHELFYTKSFNVDKKKTLILIGFPMGVYVSGIATLLPTWNVAQKHNLTVASVGNNKVEMLKLVKKLSHNFEQTILVGHPFFIKDVIETGKTEKINWSKLNLGLFFCSEGFSEEWRDYVAKEAGMEVGTNRIVSTYGCSEMLLIGTETPLALSLRRKASKDSKYKEELLGNGALPSVFQYNPLFRYIEEVKENLVFTTASGIPLIRFNLQDGGKILPYSKVANSLNVDKAVIKESWKLPFISLKGRSDHTIIFYAANIYPEHIHAALHKQSFFKQLTGKFTMKKGYKKNMDEFLEVHVETKIGAKLSEKLNKSIQVSIVRTLEKLNIEYVFLQGNLGKDLTPQVVLHPYQAEPFFKPGLKPRYISI